MKKTIALLLCAVLMLLPCAQADEAGGLLDWLMGAAENMQDLAGELGGRLEEAWSEMGGLAGEAGDGLQDFLSGAGELAGELKDTLGDAWSEAKDLAGELKGVLGEAWSGAEDFWNELAPVAAEMWGMLTDAADEYAAKLRGWITGKEDATREELMDSVREIARRAGLSDEAAGEVWEEIVSYAKDRSIDVRTAARIALVYLAGTVYSGEEVNRDDMLRELGSWLEKTGVSSEEQADQALAGLDG